MKKMLSLLVLSALTFAGCQNELETVSGGSGGERVVRISLEAPEAMALTRADGGTTNSVKGGITNVDWSKYDLRYQVAVYDAEGENLVMDPVIKTVADGYAGTSVEVQLMNGGEYTFVAWADFVTEGTTTDLHYSTVDLKNITCKDAVDKQLNDESRDAYFITKKQTVDVSAGVSLTLYRPFAKLRVIATDWNANDLSNMPDRFKITYYGCKRFTGLNAVTGVASSTDLVEGETTAYTTPVLADKTKKDYDAGYDESAQNRTITVDYLIADPEQTAIHFKLEALNGTATVATRNLDTDIPIQRNYLTTILGNLLTGGANGEPLNITVQCDENFVNEYNDFDSDGTFTPAEPEHELINGIHTYYIKTAEELAWLDIDVSNIIELNQYNQAPRKAYSIKLMNDIDLKGIDWKPVDIYEPRAGAGTGVVFYRMEIDGQGHVIRNLYIEEENGDIGLFGDLTNTYIRNLTLENVTINAPQCSHSGALVGRLWYRTHDLATNNDLKIDYSIENCKVNHVYINGKNCAGGIIGYMIDPDKPIKDCMVEQAYLQVLDGRVGGLIGSANFLLKDPQTMENCNSSEICLRRNANLGSKIGAISGWAENVIFKNCSSSNVIYIQQGNEFPYSSMVSGEEGKSGYGPKNALYGDGKNSTIL